MNVPTVEELLRPVLALSADDLITRVGATAAMAEHFQLSEQDSLARLPSGGATYIRNRVGWAMTYLTKGGLVEKVAPKQYRITERGKDFLTSHPESVTAQLNQRATPPLPLLRLPPPPNHCSREPCAYGSEVEIRNN